MKFENIDFLIDGNGDIEIGRVGPIRCAATAANEDQQLAALVRRPNETFFQLLERLDGAIGKALEDAGVGSANSDHIFSGNSDHLGSPAEAG